MVDRTETIVFGGGLDELASDFEISPGRVRRSLNYSAVVGGGYRWIGGYRRWAGRDPTVNRAALDVVEVPRIENLPTRARSISTNGVASRGVGIVQRPETATTLLIVEKEVPADRFVKGESVSATSTSLTIVTATPVLTSDEELAIEEAVREFGNDFAGRPDGDGEIVLLVAHAGEAYCFRRDGDDVAISRTFQAGTGGWIPVGSISPPSGQNFDGASWRSASYHFLGRDPEMFVVNGAGPGYVIRKVKAGADPGPVEIADSVDEPPIDVTVHREHLFLAYRGGRILTSAIGNPESFDAIEGAAEMGVTEDVTGWHQLPGDSLAITGLNRTTILSGTSSADWQLDVYSDESGAMAGTHANLPTAIHADRRGVTTLSATDAYGNYASKALTRSIDPTFQAITSGSRLFAITHRALSEYRLISDSGRGLYLTFDGQQLAGAMEVDFGQRVTATCVLTGERPYGLGDFIEIRPSDNDVCLIATEDGWVNVLDTVDEMGPNAGRPFLETADYHYRAPSTRKRFKKVDVEFMGDPHLEMNVTNVVDGGDEYHEDIEPVPLDMNARKRESYRADLLARFYQRFVGRAHLVGIGISQALRFEPKTLHPHTIRSVEVHMTPRGQER